MHYYLSRAYIEDFASAVLEQYNPDYRTVPQGLDVYDFTENFMELGMDFQNLSQDQSVLGLTVFNDGICYVWNDDLTLKTPIKVKNGTVILDKSLLDQRCDGRERFTVLHECSHQILHRSIFSMPKPDVQSGILTCAQRDISSERMQLVTSRDWIEWQANTLAAAILMPLEAVKHLFFERIGVSQSGSQAPYGMTFGLNLIVFDMSNVFGVSMQAMKIRLLQLGLIKDRVFDFDKEDESPDQEKESISV